MSESLRPTLDELRAALIFAAEKAGAEAMRLRHSIPYAPSPDAKRDLRDHAGDLEDDDRMLRWLEAHLASLLADSERIDWLDNPDAFDRVWTDEYGVYEVLGESRGFNTLREAIDAARSAEGETANGT